jgi:hypothetical protein
VTGDFKISLEDFRLVNGNRAKLLRFSLVWCFDTGAQQYGIKTEGCLAGRSGEGKLSISLPKHTMSNRGQRRVQIMTPDLHDACVRLIENSAFADFIGRTKLSRSLDFDPDAPNLEGLPKELTDDRDT